MVLLNPISQAAAATLSLSPATLSVKVGDVFNVDLVLDTGNQPVQGADVQNLNFNPALLQIQGTQLSAGSLMPDTLANSVDGQTGKIGFSQVAKGGASYTGSGVLGRASFKALSSGIADVTFDYAPGSTLDSNVASGGVDILNGVTNGHYTITVQDTGQSSGQGAQSGNADNGSVGTKTVVISGFRAQGGDSRVSLNWSNPSDSNFIKAIVVRKQGSVPTSVADGTKVYEGSGESATDTALVNSQTYYYAIFAVTPSGTSASPSQTLSAVPLAGVGALAPASRLFKYAASPTVYLLEGNVKRALSSWNQYLSAYRGIPIAVLPNTSTFSSGADIGYGSGALLKTSGSSAVFLILDNGARYGFGSAEEFLRFGYLFDLVKVISAAELERYPLSPVSRLRYHATGQFFKYPDDPTVYRMEEGYKHPIPSWAVFSAYADPRQILVVNRSDFDYPAGPAISFPDGSLIKGSAPTVYIIEGGKKRALRSAEALSKLGYGFSQITAVPDSDLNLNPTGEEVE